MPQVLVEVAGLDTVLREAIRDAPLESFRIFRDIPMAYLQNPVSALGLDVTGQETQDAVAHGLRYETVL